MIPTPRQVQNSTGKQNTEQQTRTNTTLAETTCFSGSTLQPQGHNFAVGLSLQYATQRAPKHFHLVAGLKEVTCEAHELAWNSVI
jgi:hypothetical protein